MPMIVLDVAIVGVVETREKEKEGKIMTNMQFLLVALFAGAVVSFIFALINMARRDNEVSAPRVIFPTMKVPVAVATKQELLDFVLPNIHERARAKTRKFNMRKLKNLATQIQETRSIEEIVALGNAATNSML